MGKPSFLRGLFYWRPQPNITRTLPFFMNAKLVVASFQALDIAVAPLASVSGTWAHD